MPTETIKLRYIEVTPKMLSDSLVWEGTTPPPTKDAFKWKILERLGIARQGDETPLAAWLRALAEENGLPVETPAHPEIAEAVTWNAEASRFLWFLA